MTPPPTAAPRADGAPALLVLFGATGDLARRMLFPALFELWERGLLPDRFAVIGSGRHSPGTDEDFRRQVAEAVAGAANGADPGALERFTRRIGFATASAEDGSGLAAAVRERRTELGADCRTFLYLSVPPGQADGMLRMTGREGLAEGATLMVEKPVGEDVDTARALNALLASLAPEERILRIDHFLAKESVRALLALRTANPWLAASWDARHIASVLIDVPEEIGIEGRASFMEHTGTFRDMVPTHLCQVLAAVAMEPPGSADPEAERAARLRLFERTRPFDPARTVFGQYEGYRDEDGVAADSTTETFAAVEVRIDDPRWQGVPFLLRTGKSLDSAAHRLIVRFRAEDGAQGGAEGGAQGGAEGGAQGGAQGGPEDAAQGGGTELVVGLGAAADVELGVRLSRPGPRPGAVDGVLGLAPLPGADDSLSAYAQVFHHALRGDHRVFTTAAEVERLWELAAPVLADPPPATPYPQGSAGPKPPTPDREG
ncbi:glucose-6-phosphate dehydrogenase [Kitasatospora sp. NA04385]|uniref:glucose-6-phosphate dehydrogenase n=1 Tax=Kitasatospora sp. NA04385 TaxID=2742135 RepID=UPI0020CB4327|nr:glucose-6-phosphate dehydrogenase [Kitasatospora sp. NA04385]